MRYMSVELSKISKDQYYAARSNDEVVAQRPLGFITTHDNIRTLYINSDGFYMGQLSFTQTNDMFMQMKFLEVRQFIQAQFKQPDPVMAEPVEAVTGA